MDETTPLNGLFGQGGPTVADELYNFVLSKIAQGDWPVGYTLPSEKELMEQFGISRIAVRECILKLRALGILTASQGKRTTVAKIDSRLLGHLFPLILLNEGRQSFEHVFQLRLILESHCAYQAARRRSDDDCALLQQTLGDMHAAPEGDVDALIDKDRLLHLQIAQASQNPLFPMLAEALWGFLHMLHPVIHRDCGERRTIDEHHHRSIVEAIVLQNADRARVEMEAHLQASADFIRTSGALDVRPESTPLVG